MRHINKQELFDRLARLIDDVEAYQEQNGHQFDTHVEIINEVIYMLQRLQNEFPYDMTLQHYSGLMEEPLLALSNEIKRWEIFRSNFKKQTFMIIFRVDKSKVFLKRTGEEVNTKEQCEIFLRELQKMAEKKVIHPRYISSKPNPDPMKFRTSIRRYAAEMRDWQSARGIS